MPLDTLPRTRARISPRRSCRRSPACWILKTFSVTADRWRRALPDFKVRREQLRMAQRVADALAARESLVVEAGTGTGKTFAYLVPALLSGVRVLISTGTRTLQDQLFCEGPAAGERSARAAGARRAAQGPRQLPVPLSSGARGLCRRAARAGGARRHTPARLACRCWRASSAGRAPRGAAISPKCAACRTRHPVWAQVTSTRENCLGARCPEISRCHVALARREALEADIVIVNHHLLLADLALKEDGFGDLLGCADAVILDEAHQIPDLATQFFGANVSSRQIETLLRDLRVRAVRAGRARRRAGAAAGAGGGAARRGGSAAGTARCGSPHSRPRGMDARPRRARRSGARADPGAAGAGCRGLRRRPGERARSHSPSAPMSSPPAWRGSPRSMSSRVRARWRAARAALP